MHVDLPTPAETEALLALRHPQCVSIYLRTTPLPQDIPAERIALGNLISDASARMRASGADKAGISGLEDLLDEVLDDDTLWRFLANTLAVFATPEGVQTFRLANRLETVVEVSDRFFVKPLLRAATAPQACFVLALAQGSVRLLEVVADGGPTEVPVPDLPTDAASAVGMASIGGRSPKGRLQGGEGQKVRVRQYARQVDRAIRETLRGSDLPLILAATRPTDDIYRSVNTYPRLAAEMLDGNPETLTDAELGSEARLILDRLHAAELRSLAELFEKRAGQHRTATDLADIARAATYGQVDTLIVDIDRLIPGRIDEETGALTLTDEESPDRYGVVDEMARRVLSAAGRVIAVRAEDVPGGGAASAILRWA